MYFKLTSRNPYRDFVRNIKKIASSSEENKLEQYIALYKLLSPKMLENDRFLTNQAAFGKRCEHWNQRDVSSIKPVTNLKNPWLRFKRDFEQAINNKEPSKKIEIALAWFNASEYTEDWLVE